MSRRCDWCDEIAVQTLTDTYEDAYGHERTTHEYACGYHAARYFPTYATNL